MKRRYNLILLFITLVIIWKSFQYFKFYPLNQEDEISDSDLTSVPKVKISVYYEALCGDSKFFIIHELLPVFEELGNYLTIDFVPYGKAQTVQEGEKTLFYCQHDAVECFANKIHACVIDFVQDPLLQIKYVACMIENNMIPDDAGEKCGQEFNINYAPISECAKGTRGTTLLKAYGERTHALNPPASFIPTIELDGSQTTVPQSAILKNLLKSVCQIFKRKPSKCG